eukprot:jgi/Chrzof1/490/Cz01g17200.t1
MEQLSMFAKVKQEYKLGNRIKAECVNWPRVFKEFNEYLPIKEQWCGPFDPKDAVKEVESLRSPDVKDVPGVYMILGQPQSAMYKNSLFAIYTGKSDAAGQQSSDIGERIRVHLVSNAQEGDNVYKLTRTLSDG